MKKMMPYSIGFTGIEQRLGGCNEWVRRTYCILHQCILNLDESVRVKEYARAEGLGYEIEERAFCRMDPKIDYIGIGLTNNVRNLVKATGRLREGREDRVWFNHTRGDALSDTLRLIEAAFKTR